MIPKIIHQIWLGPNPMPLQFNIWSGQLQALNPDYAFQLWTDETVEGMHMICRANYDAETSYAGRADVLRLEILKKFGGYYSDVDIDWRRSLDDGLTWDEEKFYCVREDAHILNNAFLACAPSNEFCDLLLNALRDKGPRRIDQMLPVHSGPGLLTPLALMNLSKVRILSMDVISSTSVVSGQRLAMRVRNHTPHGIHSYSNSWWTHNTATGVPTKP